MEGSREAALVEEGIIYMNCQDGWVSIGTRISPLMEGDACEGKSNWSLSPSLNKLLVGHA